MICIETTTDLATDFFVRSRSVTYGDRIYSMQRPSIVSTASVWSLNRLQPRLKFFFCSCDNEFFLIE